MASLDTCLAVSARNRLEEALASLQDANKLRAVQEGVEELMESEQRPDILRLLGEITSSIQLSAHLETRHEDPDWFKGQHQLNVYGADKLWFIESACKCSSK